MALMIGHVEVRLLAAVGDADPVEIGTLSMPLRAHADPNGGPGVTVTHDRARMRRDMKRALRAAARAI